MQGGALILTKAPVQEYQIFDLSERFNLNLPGDCILSFITCMERTPGLLHKVLTQEISVECVPQNSTYLENKYYLFKKRKKC